MHNYFVSFVYINKDTYEDKHMYDNCIMVATTDTATSTASQLDDLITRFTNQIKQQLSNADKVTILNINKMN